MFNKSRQGTQNTVPIAKHWARPAYTDILTGTEWCWWWFWIFVWPFQQCFSNILRHGVFLHSSLETQGSSIPKTTHCYVSFGSEIVCLGSFGPKCPRLDRDSRAVFILLPFESVSQVFNHGKTASGESSPLSFIAIIWRVSVKPILKFSLFSSYVFFASKGNFADFIRTYS